MMNNEEESLQVLNSLNYWDYSIELECLQGNQDLQLAAELGKTLLERNKELETALKQHQHVIEDQVQEIEYLTKQTVALREANDSRLRIYEQLEVSIQDLERANHRLVLENSAEKKHVKSLNATIDSLETKCEDIQSVVDDLNLQLDILKRKSKLPNNISMSNTSATKVTVNLRHVENPGDEEGSVSADLSALQSDENNTSYAPFEKILQPNTIQNDKNVTTSLNPLDIIEENWSADNGMEQVTQLLAQLSKMRGQCNRDERRITELEEQLSIMIQQNQALENQVVQLSHREDDTNMKSMHEELTTLEEVRQGQMCSRCLRSLDHNGTEVPEDDDSSMLDSLMTASPELHRSSFSMDVQGHGDNQPFPIETYSTNPYKKLVEKYEELVEVHSKTLKSNCMSLQEEMHISGEFHTPSTKDTDDEIGHGYSFRTKKHEKSRKTISTPTDFSEAETSSSGFADETSNKGTQTEGSVGSFLCTIADGEDCRFSIYDDASPIDSRFRDRPEYRDLFKEIFNILKKAAENKEEGDALPLLHDRTPPIQIIHQASPGSYQIPDFPDDDSQSVQSSTMSELSISQNELTTVVENIIQAQNQPIAELESVPSEKKQEQILKPLIRQPLEYLSVEVRKRSSSRRKNKHIDRSDSPVTHIIGSPKINYSSRTNSGRRRREQFKNVSTENDNTWSGNTMQFFSSNRNLASPTPSQGSAKYEFKPSTASQDLHKLKKLDMSYAEVLRNADNKKFRQRRK